MGTISESLCISSWKTTLFKKISFIVWFSVSNILLDAKNSWRDRVNELFGNQIIFSYFTKTQMKILKY